jgi:hypothetical protein
MEGISEGLINGIIKIKQAHDWVKQMQSEIEEKRRRDELRKGSIDVEFRVIQ